MYTTRHLWKIVDHNNEVLGLQVGRAAGVAQNLHIIFNNGIVYDFAPGQSMKPDDYWNDNILRLVGTLQLSIIKF